jgi:hypothetical protein
MTEELELEVPGWWLPEDIAKSVQAPLQGVVGNRCLEAYLATLGQFHVGGHPRYQRRDIDLDGDLDTTCNVYLADASTALGCPIPRSLEGRWLRAADQILWLRSEGQQRYGWVPCEKAVAMARALKGRPTVATWLNPEPKQSSHVAFVVPPPAGLSGLWVSQAGRLCGVMPITKAFGNRPIAYFTHP